MNARVETQRLDKTGSYSHRLMTLRSGEPVLLFAPVGVPTEALGRWVTG